jgi:hypothetical protein
MSPGDEANDGRHAINSGAVLRLKNQYDLSWPVLAGLMGVDPASLKMWVEGTRVPSHMSARKIGAWIHDVQNIGPISRHQPDELVSLSMAAQYLGMSYATVLQKCQAHELTCVDLGALGTFILKSDIPNLEVGHG